MCAFQNFVNVEYEHSELQWVEPSVVLVVRDGESRDPGDDVAVDR
jgi:hypothetical protein